MGSDKELSDLLDFSMVSRRLAPARPPSACPLPPGWQVLPKWSPQLPGRSGNGGMESPVGMVTPAKEVGPPTASQRGKGYSGCQPLPRHAHRTSPMWLWGAGGLGCLVRKVTLKVTGGENEVPGCADPCWGPQREKPPPPERP